MVQNFKFLKEIEIRWSDIDEYGMVNNVHYFNYFQEARHSYLKFIEWDFKIDNLVVYKHEIEYIKPLYYVDKSSIYVRVSDIGKSSFKMEYSIINQDKVEVAKGYSILVSYNNSLKKAIPIPQKFIENMKLLENL